MVEANFDWWLIVKVERYGVECSRAFVTIMMRMTRLIYNDGPVIDF